MPDNKVKHEYLKAVPAPVDEVIAMPTMQIDEFDKEMEDEARLIEVSLEQLYNCSQDYRDNTPNTRAGTYPKKGKLSRKQRNKRRAKALTGLNTPGIPDLPAMVARTVSKQEAQSNPKCIEALDKGWKSWKMPRFGYSMKYKNGVR